MLLELLNITIMDKISWALGQFWSLFSSLLALISDNDFQTITCTSLTFFNLYPSQPPLQPNNNVKRFNKEADNMIPIKLYREEGSKFNNCFEIIPTPFP